jgi:hypothetical protein
MCEVPVDYILEKAGETKMLAEISAGLGSLKTMKDIVQGLNAAKNEAAINGLKIELQGLILDAQQGLFAAQEAQSSGAQRIAQLEQQIAAFEDWNTEKQRYQLQTIDRGAFAYMHKPGMNDGEPPMWLCQTCFDKRHKSALQYIAQDRGSGSAGGRGSHSRWGCNLCKAEVVVVYTRRPSEPYVETNKPPEPPTPSVRTARIIRG